MYVYSSMDISAPQIYTYTHMYMYIHMRIYTYTHMYTYITVYIYQIYERLEGPSLFSATPAGKRRQEEQAPPPWGLRAYAAIRTEPEQL